MPLEAAPVLIVLALSGWIAAAFALIRVLCDARYIRTLQALISPLDHDGDGKPGGSKPRA